MKACIKNAERSQINYLMPDLKLLEYWEQAKSKTSRREIIKRAKINDIGTKLKKTNKHTKNQINQTQFFEKINKIDKSI
jgi:hypothetical protein